MATNTGVIFSASIIAQMEATFDFSFTFGSFPEVTVPRNPMTSSSNFEGSIFTEVRSDLISPTPVASRVSESETVNVTGMPTRVTHCPAGSADDLFSQIDRVGRSIAECIQFGEHALHHRDDPDRVIHGLSSTAIRARSNLAAPSSITYRVSELEAANVTATPPRMTRHPAGSADDLLSQIDRVGRSIAECIQLSEYVLRHHDDPDRVLYGLRNAAAMYSEQIRVPLLDPVAPSQIRSDSTSEAEPDFQETSFTLPPNRSSTPEHRRIFVISDDSDTRPNKDNEERANRHRRNDIRADRRRNEATIRQSEQNMQDADCCNPRNRHSPIRPRNLDADFVLDYNGQDIFATPLANLAAVFRVLEGLQETPEIIKARARLHVAAMQAQQMRKDNSAYRTQSSHHSTRPRDDGEEVN